MSQSYREAHDGLGQIVQQLDDLIGTYGLRYKSWGWFEVTAARDRLRGVAHAMEPYLEQEEASRP